MLTVSQVAKYTGLTVRAIRYYHQRGLLPEPERDSSGYRRYDAASVIVLIHIKTLARSGVPLVEIPRLLNAEPEELNAVVRELDESVCEKIRELELTRQRLATLGSAGAISLPDEVRRHLERLSRLGLDDDQLQLERDAWTLLNALYPGNAVDWLHRLAQLLDQDYVAELYLDIHGVRELDPDDPRIEALAIRTVTLLKKQGKHSAIAADAMRKDMHALHLVNEFSDGVSPAWSRLEEQANRLMDKDSECSAGEPGRLPSI